jgi:hypothetical protein
MASGSSGTCCARSWNDCRRNATRTTWPTTWPCASERERAEIEGLRERQAELSRLTSESERQVALIRDLFVQVSTARAQPEE